MRLRLTLAFGLLTLVVVGTFVAFRIVTTTDMATERLRAQLDREALVVATVVADARSATTAPPTPRSLAPYAVPDRQLVVTVPDRAPVEVPAPSGVREPEEEALSGYAAVGGVTARVTAPRDEVDRAVAAAVPPLLLLGATLVLLAALAGAVVASRLSRPFVVLAAAADALSRGRLDLRLPRTRVPEARAIATALGGGARQLGESLRRERDLALRASHELRTPLTGLRLELHDLRDRDDVPPDLVDTVDRAAAYVDRIDRAVGEVLEETRSHPVVLDAHLPLALVAPALAQRWTDTLSLAGVRLEAELTGDTALSLTPGPLEQLLDEVLLAVLAHRGECVRLTMHGDERHLRVTVVVEDAADPDPARGGPGPVDRARAVAETLGGRVSGDLASPAGLAVVVPRR